MNGKAVVITGAASGMGEACAHAVAEMGGAVVLADRDDGRCKAVADAIAAKGGQAVSIATDVTDEQSIKAMVDLAMDSYGRLDGAVNSAGIAQPPVKIKDLSAADWELHFKVMLFGVAMCMKHQIPAMLRTGGGSIVNISSSGGLEGVMMQGAYVAAKHGVVGITRTAALEHATDNIRVNAICPGIIKTPMFDNAQSEGADWSIVLNRCPMNRFGEPSEISDVALWLLSSRSSFVTGQAISVDGGLLAGAVYRRGEN